MKASARTPARRWARAEAALSQLTRDANAGRSPEHLLSRGLDLLLSVTALRAGIACACAKGEEAVVRATRGLRPAAVRAVEREFSLAVPDQALACRLGAQPVSAATRDLLTAEGIRRAVVLPLVSERGLVGALVGLGREARAVSAPRALLEPISRELGGAVGNAQFRHGLQRANADLLRLLTLVKILAEPRSLEDTLTAVAQAARSFARAVAVDVWLANPATRRLHRLVLLEPGAAGQIARRRTTPYGEDLVGWVAGTEQPAYLRDALADPRLADRDWARERGLTSACAFPLRFHDRLVGVLSLGLAAPLPTGHLSFLETYSDHAALAIGQADLRRRLET